MNSLLVREELVQFARGECLLALREAGTAVRLPVGLVQHFRIEVLRRRELVLRLTSL